MRKILILLVFSFAALSCAKEELEAPRTEQDSGAHNAWLLVSTGATKAAVSDDYVKLNWSQTDSLSVYTSNGRFVDFVFDRNEEQEGVARFKGVQSMNLRTRFWYLTIWEVCSHLMWSVFRKGRLLLSSQRIDL